MVLRKKMTKDASIFSDVYLFACILLEMGSKLAGSVQIKIRFHKCHFDVNSQKKMHLSASYKNNFQMGRGCL